MQSCSPILYIYPKTTVASRVQGELGKEKDLTAAMRSAHASSDLTPLLQPFKGKGGPTEEQVR